MNVYPLFSRPLMVSKVTTLTPELVQKIKSYEYMTMPNGSCAYSTDKRILNREELKPLKDEIKSTMDTYFHETLGVDRSVSLDFTTSWVVKMSHMERTITHSHYNSVFTGVVYLDVDADSSIIRFHNETPITRYAGLDLPMTGQHNMFNSKMFDYRPKNNDLIMFHSSELHEVGTNYSKEDRYSLAFNTFVRGTFGESESELTL